MHEEPTGRVRAAVEADTPEAHQQRSSSVADQTGESRGQAVGSRVQLVDITVAPLTLAHFSDLFLVVSDGSASPVTGVGAAAAVSADGRALVCWYRNEPACSTQFAELQGVRLALRLTARWESAHIFTDSADVVQMLQPGVCSRARILRGVGCNDPNAIGQVLADLRDQAVFLRWMGIPDRNWVGANPLAVRAHRLAWAARRLACDGIDPNQELAWMAQFCQNPGRDPALIQRKYRRWLDARLAAAPAALV